MLNSLVITPRSRTFSSLWNFIVSAQSSAQPSAKQFHIFNVKLRANTNIAKISRDVPHRCPAIASRRPICIGRPLLARRHFRATFLLGRCRTGRKFLSRRFARIWIALAASRIRQYSLLHDKSKDLRCAIDAISVHHCRWTGAFQRRVHLKFPFTCCMQFFVLAQTHPFAKGIADRVKSIYHLVAIIVTSVKKNMRRNILKYKGNTWPK